MLSLSPDLSPPFPVQLGFVIIKYKKQNAINTQERGAYFQELLPAMKLVKYYAWEQFFLKEVSEVSGPAAAAWDSVYVRCSGSESRSLLNGATMTHCLLFVKCRSASVSWPSSARLT